MSNVLTAPQAAPHTMHVLHHDVQATRVNEVLKVLNDGRVVQTSHELDLIHRLFSFMLRQHLHRHVEAFHDNPTPDRRTVACGCTAAPHSGIGSTPS